MHSKDKANFTANWASRVRELKAITDKLSVDARAEDAIYVSGVATEAVKLMQSLIDQQDTLEVLDAPFVETEVLEHPIDLLETNNYSYGSGCLKHVDGFSNQIERGWELVRTLVAERLVQHEATDENDRYSTYKKTEKLQVPVYVLGRRRDRTMMELRESLQRRNESTASAKEAMMHAQEEAEKLRKELEATLESRDRYEERWMERGQEIERLRESNEKLEAGLAAKDKDISDLRDKVARLA